MSTSTGRPLILLFGESENDTGALRHIVPALIPADKPVDTQLLRKPIILSKNAGKKPREEMASFVGKIEKGHSARGRKVVVVAHRDCDSVEPAHVISGTALVSDLTQAGIKSAVAATPAWCMEAWWMLFPDELKAVRPCWRRPSYGSQQVGMIERAKERLIRDLRPAGHNHKCPDYKESDSIRIAEEILKAGPINENTLSRSASLHKFKSDLLEAISKA